MPDVKNTRFGTVSVVADEDYLVKFYVNKAVTGMAKRLVKTLKGTSYKNVQILLEDGTVAEAAAEEDEAAETEGAAAAPPAAEATEAAPGGAPAAEASPALDPALLRNQLNMATLKIPEAAAGVQALHDKWSGFATKVGVLIDAGKLPEAQMAIAALVKDLAGALQGAAAAKKGTGDYGKSGKIWAATRKKMEDELTRLRTALGDAYQGTPQAGEIDAQFTARTAPLLRTLDESLLAALDACSKTDDQAERGKLADAARLVLQRYQAYVGSEKLLDELDANPFAPLALKQTLTVTLGALDKTVH